MTWMTKTLYNAIAKARQTTFELNGWIKVTPELAKDLLEFNNRNYRTLSKPAAKKYASDMRAGLWQKNGESIIFSKFGLLNDGQHRLEGIVLGGVPVVVHMIFDADACKLYDLQRKRTCVQILKDMEYSCTNISPAVARAVMNGRFVPVSKVGDMEVCEYVADHFETLKKVESIIRLRPVGNKKKVAVKAGCATVVYCLLRNHEVSESDLMDFFKVMNSDQKCGLHRDVSPAKALRYQIDSYEGHGDNLSNRFMEATYLAIKDFQNGISVITDFVYPENGKNAERLIAEIQSMDNSDDKAA